MAASTVTRVIARLGIVISVAAEELETFLARIHATALAAEVKVLEDKVAAYFAKANALTVRAAAAHQYALAEQAAAAPVVAAKAAEAEAHGA